MTKQMTELEKQLINDDELIGAYNVLHELIKKCHQGNRKMREVSLFVAEQIKYVEKNLNHDEFINNSVDALIQCTASYLVEKRYEAVQQDILINPVR